MGILACRLQYGIRMLGLRCTLLGLDAVALSSM